MNHYNPIKKMISDSLKVVEAMKKGDSISKIPGIKITNMNRKFKSGGKNSITDYESFAPKEPAKTNSMTAQETITKLIEKYEDKIYRIEESVVLHPVSDIKYLVGKVISYCDFIADLKELQNTIK